MPEPDHSRRGPEPRKLTGIQIRTRRLRAPSAAGKPERVPAATPASTSAHPQDDAKDHPNSTLPAEDTDENASGDVREFHPFDPHRAAKDIEVGDFYFKKKNYGAALDRYREALFYKPNDAVSNFRMAQALDKLARLDEAAEHYQEYLKILPNGPLAEEAKKALEKIKTSAPSGKAQARQ